MKKSNLDSQYDVKQWAAETTAGRHLFVYNFHLTGRKFRDWKLLRVQSPHSGKNQKKYEFSGDNWRPVFCK